VAQHRPADASQLVEQRDRGLLWRHALEQAGKPGVVLEQAAAKSDTSRLQVSGVR
jgi:hypothetical protein